MKKQIVAFIISLSFISVATPGLASSKYNVGILGNNTQCQGMHCGVTAQDKLLRAPYVGTRHQEDVEGYLQAQYTMPMSLPVGQAIVLGFIPFATGASLYNLGDDVNQNAGIYTGNMSTWGVEVLSKEIYAQGDTANRLDAATLVLTVGLPLAVKGLANAGGTLILMGDDIARGGGIIAGGVETAILSGTDDAIRASRPILIDAGAGTTVRTAILAKQYPNFLVVAVEPNEAALTLSKVTFARADRAGVARPHAAVLGKMDAIAPGSVQEVHVYYPNSFELVPDAMNAVKPGGRLVIVSDGHYNMGTLGNPFNLARRLNENGFEVRNILLDRDSAIEVLPQIQSDANRSFGAEYFDWAIIATKKN